ncbi:MAG: reverse transcriptase/maturase family protein [Saprospiraceae bacterium]|nr:reverse transcriptase/maturase family protein [Saprospiraceae bacterium]
MKRLGGLFDRIGMFGNLLSAFYKARKGKRQNHNVAAFEANLEWELLRLAEELNTGAYQPGAYRTFLIHDPKQRMISAAPFRDRVVHHALCNIIEPIFEPVFIPHTYANRKGKGTHAGIRYCQECVRKYRYVLKADIRKYFPGIDHEILKNIIARKIKCPRTLQLIDRIIDNSNPQEIVLDCFPGDDLFTAILRRKGLPMGNLTSQFFANLYLSPLDHFIKEELQIAGYARYVDDFVIFHPDKKRLHEVEVQIRDFLATRLRLSLHERKTFIAPTADGITFLGQRVFATHRRLKGENVRRFKKRLQKRLDAYLNGEIMPDTFETQLNSWLGHARQADTWRLRRKIFWQIREAGLNLHLKDRAWKLLERPRYKTRPPKKKFRPPSAVKRVKV